MSNYLGPGRTSVGDLTQGSVLPNLGEATPSSFLPSAPRKSPEDYKVNNFSKESEKGGTDWVGSHLSSDSVLSRVSVSAHASMPGVDQDKVPALSIPDVISLQTQMPYHNQFSSKPITSASPSSMLSSKSVPQGVNPRFGEATPFPVLPCKISSFLSGKAIALGTQMSNLPHSQVCMNTGAAAFSANHHDHPSQLSFSWDAPDAAVIRDIRTPLADPFV